MAAGRDPASPPRPQTDEQSAPAAKISEGRSDGGVVLNEGPPKHDEMGRVSTGGVDDAGVRSGEHQQGRGAGEEEEEGEGEGEGEGECGFCLFMKAGPCREEFVAWEECVEAAERKREDIVAACFQVTALLRKCMEANVDYYGPILRAEKAMEEEADKAMEEEADKAMEEDQEREARAASSIAEPARASGDVLQQGKAG